MTPINGTESQVKQGTKTGTGFITSQSSINQASSSLIEHILISEDPPTTGTNPLQQKPITGHHITPRINRGLTNAQNLPEGVGSQLVILLC